MTTERGITFEVALKPKGTLEFTIKGKYGPRLLAYILTKAEAYELAAELYKLSDQPETINDGQTNKPDDRRYTKRGPGPTAQSVIDRLRNDSEVPFVDVAAEFRISRERVRQIARDFMGETGVDRKNNAVQKVNIGH